MAVYVSRGLCAAVYLAYTYQIYKQGINPSLSEDDKIITEGPIKDFVTTRAEAMGLKKELFVYQDHYSYVGSAFFLDKAGIGVPEKANTERAWAQFMITHEIAHIQNSDMVTWAWVPLVVSIFTAFLLNSISPVAACAAGLAAGIVTLCYVHSWREKVADITAMQYCSKEVNQDVLEHLKRWKQNENQRSVPLKCRVFQYFAHPSQDERIRYFEAQIEAQKV